MKKASIYFKVTFFYLLSLIVFATTAGITKESAYPDLFSLMIATLLTLIIAYLFACWDSLNLSEIGLRWDKKNISNFLIGGCLGILLVIVMTIIVAGFADVSFERSLSFDPKVFAIYLPLYFIVACREELAFRTYMLFCTGFNIFHG